MNQRADAAKIVIETLLEQFGPDEVINILMTAWGTLVSTQDHVKARCIQMHAFTDHVQADAAMNGRV